MNLGALLQVRIDKLFSAPINVDEYVAEVGETSNEPILSLKAFNKGQLVYYINYEIVSKMEDLSV
jgi:hypothetical protein